MLRIAEGVSFNRGPNLARRLGSRLYYAFTPAVLGDSVEWQRLADSVAVEVRRHGAPAQRSAPATRGTTEAVPQDAVGEVVAKQVLAAPNPPASLALPPQTALAAAGAGGPGVTVSSVHAHNNRSNSIVNNRSSSTHNIHSNNTSNTTTVVLS